MENTPDYISTLEQIIGMLNEESRLIDSGKIKQGQFVIAAMVFPDNALIRVGYITQIRKGVGQFGSDLVFMRKADGKLIVHENQGFWQITEDQEALARKVFVNLPESEDYSHGYSCPNGIREIGYIVETSKSTASTVKSNISITVKKGDSVENISFI